MHWIRNNIPTVKGLIPILKGKIREQCVSIAGNSALEGFEFEFWPATSDYPQEIKWSPVGFGNEQQGWQIIYMLKTKARGPDIDHSYTMLVAAWCDNDSARKRILSMNFERIMPPSVRPWKSWSQWEIIWIGDEYRLVDLGEKDVDGLRRIYVDAFNRTYKIIKQKL